MLVHVRHWVLAFVAVCCLSAILPATSIADDAHPVHPLAHCPFDHPLKAEGAYAALARGVNLPNWEPNYQGLKPDDGLLLLMLQQGFTHIRLPVDGENLIARYHEKDHIAAYLDHLEATVTRLIGLGFAVTVDMHPAGQFQSLHRSKPAEAFPLLKEAWRRVLSRSDNWQRDKVYFELLNEPTPSQDIWWQQAQQLVLWFNEVDEGRRLIIGPAVYQRHEPLTASIPLQGKDLLYAIHFYDPFVFTHQAMTWAEGSFMARLKQLPFPGDLDHSAVQEQIRIFETAGDREAVQEIRNAYQMRWDAARIKDELSVIAAWSSEHKVPVLMNEFGVLNFDVDLWARVDWLRAVRQAAEAHCFGWTHWDFSDGFALVDSKTTLPDPFILDALMARP